MKKYTVFDSLRWRFIRQNFIDFVGSFLTVPTCKPQNSNGKKILIFNWRDTRHAFAGGAEVYIHELAKDWIKQGNCVTLFCGNDSHSPRNEVIDGIQIVRRGGFYFVYVWALIYYLLQFRGKYDIIIDCENGIPFFTPLYAKEKKFLVIHHVHQEIFIKNLMWPFSWLAVFLEMKAMPFIYKNVRVITVSESSKQEIMGKHLTGLTPAVIHSGIDTEFYKPGKKSTTPLILYLGRLQKYKSLSVFIESAKKLQTVLPKAQFVIAGDGEERARLEQLVRKKRLSDFVNFVGKVSEEEKRDLYQKAWIFVNPSMREGWGITTIEANACGTPIVAADVPGLRDSVRNPHTGFLIQHGNADAFAEKIAVLAKNSKLRRSMSDEAINWAGQFSWEHSSRDFLRLMNEDHTAPQEKALTGIPLRKLLFWR